MITNIIIVILLLGGVATGWSQGLIKGIGALISSIVTISGFVYVFRHWQTDSFLKIILVVALLVAFYLVFKLAYWLLEKVVKILFVIPFMKEIDKVLGAILGILAGVLTVVVVDFVFLNTTWLSFIPWEYTGILQVCLKIGKLMVIGL